MTVNNKAAPGWHRESGSTATTSPADFTPSRSDRARNVLRDAITAAGVDPFASVAILAAADSFAKMRVSDELAALVRELDRSAEVQP